MGTSSSKKMYKKKYLAATQGFCVCLAFKLQPFCMSNRHMHAYIEDRIGAICISDLTFKKTFRIKDALDLDEPLLNHAALPPGLTNCTLISYHWDLAVVQVFHRDSVRFYICNLTSQTCMYTYTMCPCTRRRPGLCEAYFTSDKSILILKASDTYYSLFPTTVGGLDPSFIEVVRLDCKPLRSNHYPFPRPEITPFAVCPDPDTPTDVYIAFWRIGGNGQIVGLTTGLDISVVNIRESSGFRIQQSRLKGAYYRFHNIYKCAYRIALGIPGRSRLINIQIPRNSKYIFLSTASVNSGPNVLPKAIKTYTITTVLREKISGNTVEEWNYDSYIGAQMDWPKLSPSGCYAFVGNQMIVSPNLGRLKSLSGICMDVLTELVLFEDIQFLPLPQRLKDVIK